MTITGNSGSMTLHLKGKTHQRRLTNQQKNSSQESEQLASDISKVGDEDIVDQISEFEFCQ